MLELIEIEDVHPLSRGKSGKKCGKKFSKVEDALNPYVQWLKEELTHAEKHYTGKDKDDYVYMDIDNTRERLGSNYRYHTDEALRRALKHVLLKHNIILKIDTRHDGKKVFRMKRIMEAEKTAYRRIQNWRSTMDVQLV